MDRPVTTSQPILDRIGLLAEPVRGSLYAFVAGQEAPVDRDAAAAALGIGRSLAAFHLDRLARSGLLAVEYRRRSGRSGPGAGRPAKFYRRPVGETVELSLPPRRYELAARLFAHGIEATGAETATERVLEAARAYGRTFGAMAVGQAEDADGTPAATRSAIVRVLTDLGFEPEQSGGAIRLRNCPFDGLVAEHRELTCATNLAMLEGLTEAATDAGLAAQPRTVPGRCCVALVER